MAKTTSAYKGYRGLYEVNPNGTIVGIVYADGFEFQPMFMFRAESEREAVYEFRREVDNDILPITDVYPDLALYSNHPRMRHLTPLKKG